MSARPRLLFYSLLIPLFVVNAGLCLNVYYDQKFISELAWKIAPAGLSQRQIVENLTHYVQENVGHLTLDEVRQMNFFQRWNYEHNIFRPGPRSVLQYGSHHLGPCQSNSRVLRALLEARGLNCAMVVMHDKDLRGIHSVLEVNYEGRRGIVSPTYGLLYVNRDDRPATIQELRADRELFLDNVRRGWQYGWGPNGRHLKLGVPYDDYVFDRAYYFNYSWFGPMRWTVFNSLKSNFGEDALFWLSRPSWYSFPGYDYLLCIDALALAIILAYCVLKRRKLAAMKTRNSTLLGEGIPSQTHFVCGYARTIPATTSATAQNQRV